MELYTAACDFVALIILLDPLSMQRIYLEVILVENPMLIGAEFLISALVVIK